MIYTNKRRSFLQQLNAIARRAQAWSSIKPISFNNKRPAIVHYVGRAY